MHQIGKDSTQDEKAASAILAVRLDDELNGRAVQVRVVQGEEPAHFLHVFKGKMVTFMGGKASGFKNLQDHDTYDVDGTRLFRIRGTSEFDVRAEQVPEVTASLASDDVFLLETPTATYIWAGKGSSDEEKAMATNIRSVVSPNAEPQMVAEGEEPEGFFDALGGKGDYNADVGLPSNPLLEPRLFHCLLTAAGSNGAGYYHLCQRVDDDVGFADGFYKSEYIKTDPTERSLDNTVIFAVKQGMEPVAFKSVFPKWDDALWDVRKLRVEEVANFDQDDLIVDDTMVLDTGAEVYVWIGNGALPDEKAKAFSMAEEYIKTDPTERSLDNTVIFAVKQGMEPVAFKSVFPKWDDALWDSDKSLDQVKLELEERNASVE
ncbi:unnamed protein product [Notodromas monacha]|uniref:Gelsolin-like domain-containing protein n=1 Tax=Notodromas monacha TaxID=399045 RepID=A0A7R9GHK0_9CRUS|nr:unnamed protein product [Notodromas monacha]CAG0921435.1 unnamed protein product [Notodromas monacha]